MSSGRVRAVGEYLADHPGAKPREVAQAFGLMDETHMRRIMQTHFGYPKGAPRGRHVSPPKTAPTRKPGVVRNAVAEYLAGNSGATPTEVTRGLELPDNAIGHVRKIMQRYHGYPKGDTPGRHVGPRSTAVALPAPPEVIAAVVDSSPNGRVNGEELARLAGKVLILTDLRTHDGAQVAKDGAHYAFKVYPL